MIKSDLVLPQQLVETQFSSDPIGRVLEKFSKPHHQEAVRTTIEYDAVGQLLSSVSPLSQERFAFDPAHNLVPVGSSGPTTNQVGADPISQGASSQGLVDDFGRLTVYEDKRYTYDAHGRLLSKRIGKHTHLQLHWNAEHQLVQSQRLDPQTGTVLSTTHYRYDPFGRRMAKLTLNELGQESKVKLASKVAGQVNSQATLFVWDGNRILQEIESNGFEVVLPPSASVDGVVKAIQVPASRTRLYVYEPDSFVPLAQAEWASPLQTFSLPEPSASQAANEKVLHDFAYFPYTTPTNATHWQVPGTNIVAPLPSFEQAQQQAVQDQQRQKANSQQTGPQQWPDVLPLSSLTIKPAHPPVFKAEDVGLEEAYFNKASEAKTVDGAFETTSNEETNNPPSLAKAQAIMQQLQPEEAALLAHMQASFNAVANKIKQASNDARLNPFKEPTPPPQGSARQVRIRYYHCDQLGTPKELTSTTGELVWYAQYKAWGNTVKVEWLQGPAGQEAGFEWGQVEGDNSSGNSSSNGNNSRSIQSHKQTQAQVQPIRFQGQYYDWETGLHYNRFRYYDPDCGRFICKDPIGLAGGLNLFQYAPNPIGWIDPFGLKKKKKGESGGINNTDSNTGICPLNCSCGSDERPWQKVYEENDGKHKTKGYWSGEKWVSPKPTNGAAALPKSVEFREKGRVGHDPANNEVIQFNRHRVDDTNCKEYWHGFVVNDKPVPMNAVVGKIAKGLGYKGK